MRCLRLRSPASAFSALLTGPAQTPFAKLPASTTTASMRLNDNSRLRCRRDTATVTEPVSAGRSTRCANSKGSGPSALGNCRERMKARSSYFRIYNIILPSPGNPYIACTIWPLPLPCPSGGSHATHCRQSRPQDTVLDLKQDSRFPIRCRLVAA